MGMPNNSRLRSVLARDRGNECVFGRLQRRDKSHLQFLKRGFEVPRCVVWPLDALVP